MTTDTDVKKDDQTSDEDTAMMASFIDKITPKLAESVMATIDTKVEERLKGISSKNDELLNKLHASKTSQSSVEEQLAALTKQISDGAAPTTEVTITKDDARDVRKYRAAKAKADEAGVPLTVDRG